MGASSSDADGTLDGVTTIGLSRRHVLCLAGMAVASVIAAPAFAALKKRIKRSPRFRPWRREQLMFTPAEITDGVIAFVQDSPDVTAVAIRARVDYGDLAAGAFSRDDVGAYFASQINSFATPEGVAHLAAQTTSPCIRSTQRLIASACDLTTSARALRSLLRDAAPDLFSGPKRRLSPPTRPGRRGHATMVALGSARLT